MTPIDEAALKAGISDEEIEAIAMQCCGELHGDELHMKRHQRIAFARALLHRSQPVAVVPAEQAEDSVMLDWLEREHFSLSAIKEPCGDDQFALWWQVTQGRKSISGHPLASPREAIRAAIGRNREAGGS